MTEISDKELAIKPGTVAVCTHDGIYVEVHGTAPVFDEMLPQYFRDALAKIDEVRVKALEGGSDSE